MEFFLPFECDNFIYLQHIVFTSTIDVKKLCFSGFWCRKFFWETLALLHLGIGKPVENTVVIIIAALLLILL